MPAGTPKQMVGLLNREITRIVRMTDMKDRWPALGFEPVANSPEEFAGRIKEDFETWGKLIRTAHLKGG
jgi:tripartite-type tricarboxylate transporter receptor subunit TctC